jgi:hypothetical protein
MVSIKCEASPRTNDKSRRLFERRARLNLILCLPVVLLWSSDSEAPGTPNTLSIAESRPKISRYRTQITECRYPGLGGVSIQLASMNNSWREEFSSTLKDCVNPRSFRWTAEI